MADVLDYMAMGGRVRQRRRALELTQEQLAERVEVSSSFIGHIERGEKKASVETIVKLARALETSTDFIAQGRHPRCEREECPMYADFLEVLRAYGMEKTR